MGNRQSDYVSPQEGDPLQHTDSNQELQDDNDLEQGPPAVPQPNRQSVDENQPNINFIFGPQFFLGTDRVSEDDFIPNLSVLQAPLQSLQNLTPPLNHTVSIKSPVNIHKNTIKLIPTEEKGVYNISFNFDCTEDCVIRIFYVAKEIVEQDRKSVSYRSMLDAQEQSKQPQPRGLSQTYTTTAVNHLDLTQFKDEDWSFKADDEVHPVVLLIEAAQPTDSTKEKKITTQITYASIVKAGENNVDLKVYKQKILYNGAFYVIHDIYGIEQLKFNNTNPAEECVICLSAPRNSVVIPCRHLCLCNECAETLRYQSNKCPICRGPVRALLKIEVSQRGVSDTIQVPSLVDDEDEEEEQILTKSSKKNKNKREKTNNNNNNGLPEDAMIEEL
jgi:hypothetical protein